MKKRGFTLVEIAIVVAIIGLLAGIAVPVVLRSVNKSNVKEARINLEMISTAVLQLAWDTGRWPNGELRSKNGDGTAERWDLSKDECGLFSNKSGIYKNWKGPYYDGAIKDPWKKLYFFDPDYRRDGVHPVVGSFGPNGVGQNRYDSDDIYILLDD